MTVMLGSQVAAVRKALGLSQHQLATLLGVAPMTVSKWERDILRVSLHHTQMLDAFGAAVRAAPDIHTWLPGLTDRIGVPRALYRVLDAAYGIVTELN